MTDQTSSSTTTKTEKKVEKKEGEGFSPLLIAGIVAGIVIIAVLVVWLGADSKSTLSARQALPGVSTTVQPSTTSSPHSAEVRLEMLEKRLTALEQADIPLLRQDVARLQQSPKVTTTSEGVFLESGIKGSEDKLLKTTSGKDSSLAACNCCCEQPKPRVVHKPRKKPVIATRTVAASPVASHATASASGVATATATATAGAPPQVVASAPAVALLPQPVLSRAGLRNCQARSNGTLLHVATGKRLAEHTVVAEKPIWEIDPSVSASTPPERIREICRGWSERAFTENGYRADYYGQPKEGGRR